MSPNDARPQDSWVIGSAPACDLQVTDSTISARHCRLIRIGAGFTVEDLGSTNGTFVNGNRLKPKEPVRVLYKTPVSLAGRVEMPWPPAVSEFANDSPVREQTTISPGPGRASGLGSAPGFASRPRTITIGRSPESSVRIDLPIVSWNHAVITEENGHYILEDRNSRNGTAIGELNNRIQRAVLDPNDVVYLGSYKISASRLLSPEHTVEIGESAFTKVPFRGSVMEIGRDPQCDVPLAFPMVSWRHARLTRAAEGILVEDLDSRNGTYVDGIRISGSVLVRPGQEIGLGSFRFQLLEGGELARREYYGNVTIEAESVTVDAPNGKRLLDPVSLTVFPSELVALMGPAGAGKTTLLKALNGYTRPVSGTVLFNGANLYRYYDRFRQQMGYVPQDDIVHPQLTVRQALHFSARLRTDLSNEEIEARTQNVLSDLGIPDKIDVVIGSPERKTLSGGQRKRVNIALELITDTPVLFLDEPTSGLSSYDAESVVDLLKGLSKTGKTIITTIHQPSLRVYKQFDDLIMISRDKGNNPGAMVFFGPAFPDSIQFFNPAGTGSRKPLEQQELNPEMLFSGMNNVTEAVRTETWRQRYQASRYQMEFVANRSGKQPDNQGIAEDQNPRRQFGLQQLPALIRRNIYVKLQDRTQTLVLLAQAPMFAVLVWMVNYPLKAATASAHDFGDLAMKLPIVHFLMVVAAVWFGCNNAAREVVGEWIIYKRERMVTLKLFPYVMSKFTVLFALCLFQCGSLLTIVYVACGLHSNFFYDFAVLMLAAMIGVGMGLCISAISSTTEAAISLLPVVLLPIIALGGGMRPVYQMPKPGQVLSFIIPSRWAFEANLLNEAESPKWGTPKPTPDITCTLEPDQPAPVSGQVPSPADAAVGRPWLTIVGDAAESNIPKYILTAKDSSGTEQTCRAVAGEQYPGVHPTAHSISYRHRFRYSLVMLGSMLTLLVGGVIAILQKRDNDPR